jgi:hypothetical protein
LNESPINKLRGETPIDIDISIEMVPKHNRGLFDLIKEEESKDLSTYKASGRNHQNKIEE